MDRVAPTGPAQAAVQASALPQGRGWAVLRGEAGLVLRLLGAGTELPVSQADVAALQRGDLTAALLLDRAGMALAAPPPPPPPPIHGTAVSISAEGRRKAGQAGTAPADPHKTDAAATDWQLPRAAWIMAGLLALILAVLLGMA